MTTKEGYCTYRNGFKLKYGRDITAYKLLEVLENLQGEFGSDYKFDLEAISEGGIIFTEFPNKTNQSYKSLRFHLYEYEVGYPVIKSSYLETIKSNEDFVIWKCPKHHSDKSKRKNTIIGSTFLKAFHGAPVWTKCEIDLFRNAFERAGFQVTDYSRLTNKHLCSYGVLGGVRTLNS